ncbi:DNA-binding transcriptional regulator DsdC [Acinetobacter qingfengensis]|uniref:Colanic acid biosynthesis glycosyltransferase WcaA n=1 Tax=Acinetobacter qingfengensis TaxID=1262585 RepID=A0A1E7QWN1_9GAMM|nr:DNA-binding transcriptional regulator DsdC [Acinetobacter qingfengensis]KAA8731248.1 DNA-binding transcriptional regulator DsdC [Acinetobacter qingfengensis]OEY91505.1 colanic acid biosynthesis glycosyltransferase WcaA [Acinetobacter qingfengensis]
MPDSNKLHHHLNASQFANLHTFFVVARFLSFKKAADFLCLTSSAVSHRIHRLENSLGIKLFQRLTRSIVLTHDGERIFKILSKSMIDLDEAMQPVTEDNIEGRISVYAPPSFAQCWLIPHFTEFSERYPGLSIDLRVGNDTIDFRVHNIDLAIEYAIGDFIGLNSEKIMSERITPVCSPAYAEQYHLHNQPENLSQCVLLHDSFAWPHAAYDSEWNAWLKHMHYDIQLSEKCFSFDRSDLCAVAAIHHAGIAIGREQLVQKYIENGQLIAPFGTFKKLSSYGYYMVHSQMNRLPLKTRIFKKFLLEKAVLQIH